MSMPNLNFFFSEVYSTCMINGSVCSVPNAILSVKARTYYKTYINFKNLARIITILISENLYNSFYNDDVQIMV